jgi:predicted nucleic acid-binding Zn ribbon protein
MNCIVCSKEITAKQIRAAQAFNREPKFCCKKHYTEFRNKPPDIKKYCLLCNKELTTWQIKHNKKYCSKTCGGYANRKYDINKKCTQCGKQLTKQQISSGDKFCTQLCQARSIRSPKYTWRYEEGPCIVCGKKITVLPRSKTCSKKCRYKLYHDNIFPNYNKSACNWFKTFDEINQTNGRYASFGGGEYFIDNLGYWVDYVNFDKKIIIEWDESRHHQVKRKNKDQIRQEKISKLFSDFNFIRIDEEKFEDYPLKLEELLEENKCRI